MDQPMEKRVYNGQEIKPASLELGVGPAGGKPEMLGEEKGGGESRGGEHYLNHNLKISTHVKEGEHRASLGDL